MPPAREPPPFDAGGGSGWGGGRGFWAGVGGGGWYAFSCSTMCGSRRTLIDNVNSSLLCSILAYEVSRFKRRGMENVQFELLINSAIPRERSLWSRYEVNAVVERAGDSSCLLRYRNL